MDFEIDLAREKMELRAEMKARRAIFNEAERARASLAMCLRVANWLATRPERTLGVYLARPQEISLDMLIEQLLLQGYEIAAPRVDVARREMSFWRLESLCDVEIGPWNVRQPWPKQRVGDLSDDLSLVIVPGLAFDGTGGRLGTGGGWYDQFLGDEKIVVGTCFDCQILPRVPLEDHDRPVQFVASENRWMQVDSLRK